MNSKNVKEFLFEYTKKYLPTKININTSFSTFITYSRQLPGIRYRYILGVQSPRTYLGSDIGISLRLGVQSPENYLGSDIGISLKYRVWKSWALILWASWADLKSGKWSTKTKKITTTKWKGPLKNSGTWILDPNWQNGSGSGKLIPKISIPNWCILPPAEQEKCTW